MKYLYLACFSACLLAMHGCNPANHNKTKETVPANSKVETEAPNSPDFKPAFAGQTRVQGVHTATPLDVKVVTNTLVNPWGMALLPDGRFLVTEKAGTFKIVAADGTVSPPITGIPPVNPAGQGGLLDVAIDPAFAANRTIYWSFAEKQPDGNCTAVGKGILAKDEKTIENAQVIYRALPAFPSNLHYGSRIVFDRSGNLFVSTGERSDKRSRPQAQQLGSALGKVVRITTSGQPVSDNPFINTAGARPEIYSYGHRNVQSLAIHPVTGELWEGEFGPRGGDEINIIHAGKNYGWPVISYGIEYSGEKIDGALTQHEGMEQPVYYWDPVLSPSGMAYYTGSLIPEWKNNLFIGGLSSMHICRLVIENNKVVGEERLLANEQQRFRDVAVGSDGALYAICDGEHGRMYRIGKR